MAIVVDGGESREELFSSNMIEEGLYVFEVASAEEKDTEGYVALQAEVVGGEQPGQEGKTITERLYFTGKDADKTKSAMRRCKAWALILGIVTEEELLAKQVALPFDQSIGNRFVGRVSHQEGVNKNGQKTTFARLGWLDVWAMNDPEVATVVASIGGAGAMGGGTEAPAASSAASFDDDNF